MSSSSERRQPSRPPQPSLLAREDQIRLAAQAILGKSGHHPLQTVRCEFHEGVLTLRGRVPTFYLKQIAQTLVQSLDGILEINNRLEVGRASPTNREVP